VFIARAVCGVTHVTVAACSAAAVCCVSQTVTQQQQTRLESQ